MGQKYSKNDTLTDKDFKLKEGQVILKVTDNQTLHYTKNISNNNKKDRIQANHYYFKNKKSLINDPLSLLYVKNNDIHSNKILYIIPPNEIAKKKRQQINKDQNLQIKNDDNKNNLNDTPLILNPIGANTECLLCGTDAMIEPLISNICQHVCCNECWTTWIDETKETGQIMCPECEQVINNPTKDLVKVKLCCMCFSPITKDNIQAPCGTNGCKECWKSWIANMYGDIKDNLIIQCPECSIDFNVNQLHL